jgi:hypothetical protein
LLNSAVVAKMRDAARTRASDKVSGASMRPQCIGAGKAWGRPIGRGKSDTVGLSAPRLEKESEVGRQSCGPIAAVTGASQAKVQALS